MKNFIVIGLGRFGTAVARELFDLGYEVLAVDKHSEKVQAIADKVTHAVTGDACDPAVLRSLDPQAYDCAVVAMSDDIGNSALVTMLLKEMGIAEIVCKARNHTHKKVLMRIGADRVVFPEHEMGIKLAQGLVHSNILNYIELSDSCGIVELPLPTTWEKKSIAELNVRAAYHVNVIAIRREDSGELQVSPGGEYGFQKGDILVILGKNEDTDRLLTL